jgi:hypothetical protein
MRFGKGSLAPTTLLVGGPAFLTLMRPGKAQSPALQARIEALERQVQGLQAVIQELLKRPDATMDAPGERVASSVLPQVPPPPPKPAAPLVAQAQPPAPPAPPTVPRTSSGRSQCSSNGSWTIRSRCRGRGVGARALSDVDATTCLLLPYGQAELQLSLKYTRRENDALRMSTDDGSEFIASTNVRRDELAAALGLRVRLPYDAQFELSLPCATSINLKWRQSGSRRGARPATAASAWAT